MPDQTKHIISHYDAALYALRNDVVMMFKLTDRLLETALAALLNRDSELCKQAIIQEEEIKTFGKKIDREGLSLLVLFHPVATDMRLVVSGMKVSANLAHISDQSVIVARRAQCLNSRPLVTQIELVEPAYRQAVSIFRDSMRVFAEGDCELAHALKPRDEELDKLTTNISEELVSRATLDVENVPSYLDLIFVSRALKRIGDHATNIGGDSFWRDQAMDIST